MTDRDVRDFLHLMAAEEPVTFLDAAPLLRRARRRAARTVVVGAVGVAAAIALVFAGVAELRTAPIPANDPTPNPAPSVDLGIFAPVAGRIVYGDRDGIWGVDPAASADPATRLQLTSEAGVPLGWSSDGTRLLIMREVRGERAGWHLFVLHADGSETQVTERPMGWIPGATISPEGSRVVFAGSHALYAVDVDNGRTEVLLEAGKRYVEAYDRVVKTAVYEPTFSPDGTQIAYMDGSGDHSHSVWMMNADGSDAHQIVSNEWTNEAGHVFGLAWSPAGDQIALGLQETTYTFATDGSGFTRVITYGHRPYWSPDGSQLAYKIPCGGCGLEIADADGSNARGLALPTNSGPWHPGVSATDEPAPALDPPTPTPLPAPRSVALAYEIDGDIYVADADGSNAVRIADGASPDGGNNNCADGEQHAEYGLSGEAWSPDGRYLAYWEYGCPVPPGAWGTVLITDPEGTLIGSFPGQGWANAWSPDSTRIAVWDSWGGPEDATIGVYGLDGTRQAALTVPRELMPSGDQSPAWSRDGSSILLPGLQVPLDGSPPQAFDLMHTGVYSPDGSRVAYLEGSYRGPLVVADADGSDAQKTDPPEIWYAAWSPDGDLVAFVPDQTELLVRDVATGADTSLVDVTRSEILSVIEFFPAGDRILFTKWDTDTSRGSLWSINADGSDLRRLGGGIRWADLQPQGGPS
jgi:Tol biopolymer transport system component